MFSSGEKRNFFFSSVSISSKSDFFLIAIRVLFDVFLHFSLNTIKIAATDVQLNFYFWRFIDEIRNDCYFPFLFVFFLSLSQSFTKIERNAWLVLGLPLIWCGEYFWSIDYLNWKWFLNTKLEKKSVISISFPRRRRRFGWLTAIGFSAVIYYIIHIYTIDTDLYTRVRFTVFFFSRCTIVLVDQLISHLSTLNNECNSVMNYFFFVRSFRYFVSFICSSIAISLPIPCFLCINIYIYSSFSVDCAFFFSNKI